jgi:hypothetical protein
MTALIFVLGCVAFAVVAAWAYSVAPSDPRSSGEGLLAMVESASPEVKQAAPSPRWRRSAAPKAGARRPFDRATAVRPATRGWPRRRGGL